MDISLRKRYPNSRTEDITEAFSYGFEHGYKTGYDVACNQLLEAYKKSKDMLEALLMMQAMQGATINEGEAPAPEVTE